ncbi:MAG: hypothetical protein PF488_00100 [Patescibacteria group bacterium]|jgi:hypothetical protein|nr:hypothetical protein [Patescibacteria group bacterium]
MSEKLKDEFISREQKYFKFKFGQLLASSLAGFLTGIIVTLIIFLALFNLTLK